MNTSKRKTSKHRNWRNVVFLLISLVCFCIAFTSFQAYNDLYARLHEGGDLVTDTAGDVIAFSMLGPQSLLVAIVAATIGLTLFLLAIFVKWKRR